MNGIHSARGVLAVAVTVTAWRLATLVAHPLNLSFDEAQYWIWAQTPAWGYFSKPPLIGWVIALTTHLCGEGEPCIRLGAPLAYFVGSLALYEVGRRLYTPVVGFWSAVLFLTLPGVAFSAMIISVDPFLLMFWSLGLAVLVRALAEKHLGWWGVLGVILGLGLLAKYAMLFFMVSLLLYLAWSPARSVRTAGPWLAMAVAGVFLAPNLVWNVANGFVTVKHTGANAHWDTGTLLHPLAGIAFIGAQWAVFGPVPMTVLVWLLGRGRRLLGEDANARLLVSFILPVLAVMSGEAFLSRAHANWGASAFVPATVLVVAWLVRLNKAWLLRVTLAVHLAAAAVLYTLDQTAVAVGYPLTARSDPFKRVRGFDAVGRAVGRLRADHPGVALLFDSRKVLAPVVYYARPVAFDAVLWNDSGTVNNHFEMVTDIRRAIGHTFLLVTEQPTADHVAHAFARTELVAVLRVPVHADFTREIRIFRCESFQGYGQGR
ncbi:MAG: glycosyl transferase family 39 [Rhodospirillaceae bacterium]|nr:MAG: glycosyl transferase family 39 [Rhodospirillaceae bacterium]